MNGLVACAATALVFLLPLPALGQGAAGAAPAAQIHVTEEAGFLYVTGTYAGPAAAADSLTYRLEVRKEGASGASATAQSGAVRPESAARLSAVRLSVQPGDRVFLHLSILAGERLIAQDSLHRLLSPVR